MTFDLEKFKAGQPALTRRGEKRHFIALVPEMHERFRLLARPEKGMTIYFYDEQGRISGGRSMDDMDSMYEEPQEPRQIDWSKIAGSNVPVNVWSEGYEAVTSFLAEYEPGDGIFPFNTEEDTYGSASLETGLWVFNDEGKNPWPEGVLVEVWRRDGVRKSIRKQWLWGLADMGSDIIASRAIGLEDGWRY